MTAGGLAIPWRCSTCNATFPSREAMVGHREAEHPAQVAAGIVYMQVIERGGEEWQAEIAYEKALREYEAKEVA